MVRAALLAAGLAGVLAVSACTSGTDSAATGTPTSASEAASSGQAASDPAASDQAAGYQGGDAQGATTMALPGPTSTPASTVGVAPAPGNINQEVPAQTLTTAAAQPADQPGDFGSGVSARVVSMTAVDGVGAGPGESSAPAVAVTVEIQNSSSDAIGLDSVQVDLRTSDDLPASPLSGAPAAPLAGSLAPGESRSGVYVFDVPTGDRADLRLLLSYSTQAPVLQFTGSV